MHTWACRNNLTGARSRCCAMPIEKLRRFERATPFDCGEGAHNKVNSPQWFARSVRRVLLITLAWLLTFSSPVQAADSGLRRFGIGIQTADVRTGCIGSAFSCPIPSFALGAGGAMNLNPHFSLDANFLITPQSASYITNTLGGHASELLLGARAEVRARHYGFFFQAQSGY